MKKDKVCVKCRHEGDTNSRGICETEGCFGGTVWRSCACKCEFPEASLSANEQWIRNIGGTVKGEASQDSLGVPENQGKGRVGLSESDMAKRIFGEEDNPSRADRQGQERQLTGLLPCPFCGEQPEQIAVNDVIPFRVRCGTLGCPMDLTMIPAERWNTRADSPTAAALREALEELLEAHIASDDKCPAVIKARTALAKHEEGEHEGTS